MKKLTIVLSLICLTVLVSSPLQVAKADTPVVTITSPTANTTYFTSSFPYSTNISFNIQHNQLFQLNGLNVEVNGASILAGGNPIGNPLSGPMNTNICTANLLAQATCNVIDSSHASISVPWSVPEPGTYTITVSIRHGGAEGEGEVEDVTYALVAVEFPAPPAVANEYLNSTYTKAQLSGKKRGCIISMIANNHAQDSKYGPKGGPYDNALIESDSVTYFGQCQ